MTELDGKNVPSIEVIRPDWLVPSNVQAFSTTRMGGFSQGQWGQLNLGDSCGDDPDHVRKNRDLLQSLLPSEPRWLRQVHGNRVLNWSKADGDRPEADAITSNQARQVCAIMTADCLPVLFCNRNGTEVAASHAGWRGLASGVLEATVSTLACAPGELMAWLGPAIGPGVYEVGAEVYETFMTMDSDHAGSFKPSGDRWLADLYSIARQVLASAGVGRVSGGRYCTYSEPGRFFSYRRDGVTGRMASVIWLEKSGMVG
jgi:hypothetical protein